MLSRLLLQQLKCSPQQRFDVVEKSPQANTPVSLADGTTLEYVYHYKASLTTTAIDT